jgi:hypothetical protein
MGKSNCAQSFKGLLISVVAPCSVVFEVAQCPFECLVMAFDYRTRRRVVAE